MVRDFQKSDSCPYACVLSFDEDDEAQSIVVPSAKVFTPDSTLSLSHTHTFIYTYIYIYAQLSLSEHK